MDQQKWNIFFIPNLNFTTPIFLFFPMDMSTRRANNTYN